jgi:putative ABC transport system permease protein
VALVVAGLGIINTMLMAVLERTREIGVMKAIGGGDADVRRIFLIEAALIGLAGGVFGIVLGWSVGRVINAGTNYYLATQGVPAANLFLIPWWLIAGAIGFALVVSLIAGSFPAMRAARLDPIQALRHRLSRAESLSVVPAAPPTIRARQRREFATVRVCYPYTPAQ